MRERGDSVAAVWAVLVLLVCLAALGGVVYLAFLFPHTVAVWAETGRKLSHPEVLAVNLSNFCKAYGLILIPGLFLCLAGAILWVGRVVFRPRAEESADTLSR